MDTGDIMKLLGEMGLAMIATCGDGIVSKSDGQEAHTCQPHVRPIHIGHADRSGLYFMTSPETNFYKQLMANDQIAVTAFSEDDYLIQVIRIEGRAKPVDYQELKALLDNNPYVNQVYPDADQQSYMQVFHCYQGQGFYHSLTQGHRYRFEF